MYRYINTRDVIYDNDRPAPYNSRISDFAIRVRACGAITRESRRGSACRVVSDWNRILLIARRTDIARIAFSR